MVRKKQQPVASDRDRTVSATGFPCPVLGQVQHQPPGPMRHPGRNRDDLTPDRRGGGPGHRPRSNDPGRAGEVERHDRQHQPRGEHTGRHMRQRTVLQIRVDLFNDRVPAVSFIRSHSIQQCGVGGGEHRMETVQIKQARLVHVLLVQLWYPADHLTSGNLIGLRLRRKRNEGDFRAFRRNTLTLYDSLGISTD